MSESLQGFLGSISEIGPASLILDAALKGTFVLLAAGLCALTLGRASAALRHFVWCLAFTALVALPVMTVALPSWQVPGLNSFVESWATSLSPPVEQAPAPIDATAQPVAESTMIDPVPAEFSPTMVGARTGAPISTTKVTVSPTQPKAAAAPMFSWRRAVPRIWFLGMCAALAPLAAGMLAQRWLSRRVRRLSDRAWLEPLEELRGYFKIWRRVTLCVSTRPVVPLTLGVVQPVVLIPAEGCDWQPERRRVVLKHEHAHVSRPDVLTQIFAQVVCALYWFHPLVWFAARRMRIERETACDDRVLNAGVRPSTYAQHLLEIACLSRRRLIPATASVGMPAGSKLESRVTTILDTRRDRGPLAHSTIIIGMSLALLGAAALASAAVGDAGSPKVKKSPLPVSSSANLDASLTTSTPTADPTRLAVVEPRAIPGFLAAPAPHEGVGRWQMITSSPRGSIWAVAWSHDGKRIAFAEGANLRIVDAASMRTERILVGHTGKVTCVQWSHDDHSLASSSSDGTTRIWNSDGSPGRVFDAESGGVRSVTWNPNGREVAAAGADGRVRIWNIDGTPGRVLEGHTAPVNAVAWSPDGLHIVSGCDRREVRLWSADGTPGPVMEGHAGAVLALTWCPDSKRIASSDFGFDPGDSDQEHHSSVRLWSIDGKPQRVFMGKNNAQTHTVVWSPDGEWIAASGWDGRVRLWSADGSRSRVLNDTSICIYSLAWSPDSKHLVSGCRHLNGQMPARLLVWDLDGSTPHGMTTGGSPILDVKWNPEGDRFAAACRDGKVRIWDSGGNLLRTLSVGRYEVYSVAWAPDGTQIAAVSRQDHLLKIWDTETWRITRSTIEDQSLRSLAWSADGRKLVVGADNNSVLLFDLATGERATLKGHHHGVSAVAWNPKGDQFATTSFDSAVRIWNGDGSPGNILEEFGTPNRSLAWSPDGRQLVAGREDNNLKIWGADGTPGPLLSGHEGFVQAVAWSPDGQRIASGSWDDSIRLWSADGRPQAVYRGHGASVFAVNWHPNSRHLLSAAFDGTIRMWDSETGTCNFSVVLRDDGASAVLDSKGELLSGDESVIDSEFVYLVENSSGSYEVMNPREFRRRTVGDTTAESVFEPTSHTR